jgi:hypothetical protein
MDPSAWSDWGFAAAVTGVLLTGGGAVVKWLFSFVSDVTKSHAIERREWADSHKAERAEWKNDLRAIREDSNERLDRVCDALTMAISELSEMDKKEEN